MAGRAAATQIISEDDEGGTPVPSSAEAQGADTLVSLREGGSAGDDNTEYVILDEDDGARQGDGSEGRLTEGEVGDQPLIDRSAQQRMYSKADVAAMSPEQRGELWRGLSHDERRQNRHLGRARQKDARRNGVAETEDLRRQVGDLSAQLQQVRGQVGDFAPRIQEFSRGQVQSQMNDYDRRIVDFKGRLDAANVKIRQAMQESDGDALVAAMGERDEATLGHYRTTTERDAFKRTVDTMAEGGSVQNERQPTQRQPQRQEQRTVSPAAQRNIQNFMDDHPWYDPQAHLKNNGDMDSVILSMLDAQVAREGFDPATPEYWDELEDRARERLPSRFDDEDAPVRKAAAPRRAAPRRPAASERRGPVTNGPGDGGAPRPKGQVGVRLTPGRKSALIAAGALDSDGKTVLDRGRFQRYLQQYASYDRENGEVRQ